MWLIAETTAYVRLEWWMPDTNSAGEYINSTMKPRVALEATQEMSLAQWELLKKQFDNLGLRPARKDEDLPVPSRASHAS